MTSRDEELERLREFVRRVRAHYFGLPGEYPQHPERHVPGYCWPRDSWFETESRELLGLPATERAE